MRNILIILLLVVVIGVVLMMTGVIDIDQTEEAALPEITVEEGNMPEFDADVADVEVGTDTMEVEVPTLDVEAADAGEESPE